MDELEQALSATGLTGDHDDQDDIDDHDVDYSHNGMSDDDKKLLQHCIELIKVLHHTTSLIM